MNKHIVFAIALTAASATSSAHEPMEAPALTRALTDGSHAQLLQPVALDKHTAKVAELRVDVAVEALNEKLSKQLDEKFAEDLRITSR